MALPLVTVAGKITAASTNAEIVIVNEMGLTSVIPTSVAVAAGVSLGNAGKVTFAAATALSVNGCFTATYDNYRIIIDITASSAAQVPTMRLRASAADDSTANYDGEALTGTTTVPAAGPNVAATSWSITTAAQNIHRITLDVFAPFLTRSTGALGISLSWPTAFAGMTVGQVGYGHRAPTSYDGFTLTPGSGTITGNLRIYGYNNN